MIRTRAVFAISSIMVLASCSDPTGPCGGKYACQVNGVDLAITDMRIVGGERIGIDPVTRLPIYTTAPVEIEVTIVNRGDSMSTEWRGIPPLRPGEAHKAIMTSTPQPVVFMWWDDTTNAREADVHTAVAAHILQDADLSNNRREVKYHVVRPVVAIRGQIHNRTELRANEPFVMSFVVENRSVRNAPLDSVFVAMCPIDYDVGCWNKYPYFARVDLPTVYPNLRYENAYPVTMPMSSLMWADAEYPTDIDVCITRTSEPGPFLPLAFNTFGCSHVAVLPVRPDFESCNPPVLELGVTITLTTHNCARHPEAYPDGRYSVFALDAEAGRTYHVTGVHDVLDADGMDSDLPEPGISFATSGRYYLTSWHYLPISVTLTSIE